MMANVTNSAVVCQEDRVNAVVLKRLKFVFKIVKALVTQSNARNRQAHVYILEVLDSIGDWSGIPNSELTELTDKQIFPHICRLISTFSNDEFNSFQQYFCKYLFTKWEETLNFLKLDFLADIYGFISSIAPDPVVVELIQTFQQPDIPSHVSLVILPSIMRNVSGTVANDVSDKISRHLLSLQRREQLPSAYLKVILQFWNNLKVSVNKIMSVYQLAPILHRCTATSVYLELFEEKDILLILQSLTEWSNSPNWTTINSEGFLLVSTIFVYFISAIALRKQQSEIITPMTDLMKRVVVLTQNCRNRRIRIFVTTILQRILEYATENDFETEVLSEFVLSCQIGDDVCIGGNKHDILFDTLESSVKKISSEVDVKINEVRRKRIELVIESLQKLSEHHDDDN